jgi:hypothetical protein
MFAQVLRQPPYAGQNDADTNRISSSVQSLEKIGTYGLPYIFSTNCPLPYSQGVLPLDFGHSGIDPLQTRQERAGAVRKLDEVW